MKNVAIKYSWTRLAFLTLLLWLPSAIMAGPTMTGTVRNKSTGASIVDQATLSLYGWNSATEKEFVVISAKTDAQGKYKFDSLPPEGSGGVDVTRDGYKTFHQVVLYSGSGNSVWEL